MPVVSIKTVVPNTLYIETDDTLADVTEVGYLDSSRAAGINLSNKEMALVKTSDAGVIWLDVSDTITNVSLENRINPSNVDLPVIDGDFANFDGVTGKIKDQGFSASDTAKSVVSMVDGSTVVGNFIKSSDVNGTIADMSAAPSDPTKTIVSMSDGGMTAGNMIQAADVNGTLSDSGLISSRIMKSSFNSPDINSNIFTTNITVNSALMASGGMVVLVESSGSKQYRVLDLKMNRGGVNFGGIGGDRMLNITDGTASFSLVPVSTLISVINLAWGLVGLPFPASVPLNTLSQPGEDIFVEYSGGTLDYTSGSTIISALIERVV